MNFSVAMCVYEGDNPLFFDKAIKSILDNTLIPDEIILIVDGPISKKHEQIIDKYLKELTVYRFKENQGHGVARRKSLELCNNELVALMDADDICLKDRFEKQINVFKNNSKLSIVGGQIEEFIDNVENIIGKREVPLSDDNIKTYMKKRCPMNQVTVMFKKKDIIKVGNYLDWYSNEDYYLWIRMALNNLKFQNIDDTLVYVRVGKEAYQRRGGKKYFLSEFRLQNYMLKKGIISVPRWVINVAERFVLQIVMPNKLRGIIFQKLARR